MRKKYIYSFICMGILFLPVLTAYAQPRLGPTGKYDETINESVTTIQADNRIDAGNVGGADAVNELIFKVIANIIIPIAVLAGITYAIIGFYLMMFKESSDEIQKGTNLFIWGTVGVILLVSARYIGNVLWDRILQEGAVASLVGIQLAEQLYSMVLYPFLKLGIYIVIGVLFFIMITRVFQFLASDESAIQDKSIKIIATNALGIAIIMGSKQLVEAVYGKREDVMNTDAVNIGQLGGGILADKNIPILYHAIEWIMGISAFLVLVIIIVQTFRLLAQPTNEEQIDVIKKTVLYVGLGVLVIGAGYLISNFLVVT